jgi:hypothetical protein
MNSNRNTIGYIEDGRVMNSSRNIIGYIEDGRVMNSNRNTIGYVEDGRVMNSNRNTLGYCESIRPFNAALFFFTDNLFFDISFKIILKTFSKSTFFLFSACQRQNFSKKSPINKKKTCFFKNISFLLL